MIISEEEDIMTAVHVVQTAERIKVIQVGSEANAEKIGAFLRSKKPGDQFPIKI